LRTRIERCALPLRARIVRLAPFVAMALMLGLPTLDAVGALGPLNDLLALGQGGGQTPAKAPVAQRAEPPATSGPPTPAWR